jgi:hypothetical protein
MTYIDPQIQKQIASIRMDSKRRILQLKQQAKEKAMRKREEEKALKERQKNLESNSNFKD